MAKVKNVDVHINIGDDKKFLGWYEYDYENLSKKELILRVISKAYKWIKEDIPPISDYTYWRLDKEQKMPMFSNRELVQLRKLLSKTECEDRTLRERKEMLINKIENLLSEQGIEIGK